MNNASEIDRVSSVAAIEAMVMGERRVLSFRELSSCLSMLTDHAKALLVEYASQHAAEIVCVWTVTVRMQDNSTKVMLKRCPYPGPDTSDGLPVLSKSIWGIAPQFAAPPCESPDMWVASDRARDVDLVKMPPEDVNELRDNRWSACKSDTAGWILSKSAPGISEKLDTRQSLGNLSSSVARDSSKRTASLMNHARTSIKKESRMSKQAPDVQRTVPDTSSRTTHEPALSFARRNSFSGSGTVVQTSGQSGREGKDTSRRSSSAPKRRRKLEESDEDVDFVSFPNRRLEEMSSVGTDVRRHNTSIGESARADDVRADLKQRPSPSVQKGVSGKYSRAARQVELSENDCGEQCNARSTRDSSTASADQNGSLRSRKRRNAGHTNHPSLSVHLDSNGTHVSVEEHEQPGEQHVETKNAESREPASRTSTNPSKRFRRVVEETIVDEKGYMVTRQVTKWFNDDGSEVLETGARKDGVDDSSISNPATVPNDVAAKDDTREVNAKGNSDEASKAIEKQPKASSKPAAAENTKRSRRKSKGNIASYFGTG